MDTLAKATEAHSRPTASSTLGQSPSSRKKADGRFTKRRQDGLDQNLREMKLNIPAQVKARLINDRDTVMKDKKLVTLPRSPTVRELLKEFETYVKDTRPVQLFSRSQTLYILQLVPRYIDCSVRITSSFIPAAFNETPSLKDPLLLIPAVVSGIKYGVMRAKYITGQIVVVGQEKEMSEIYGAEHLLRMLVTLSTMIAQSTLDAESTNIVRDYVIYVPQLFQGQLMSRQHD
ncbi:MRG-domain-containing protein [Mycena leptocephala]|nr:MRG-domain-containing protein [Mycena leptocephala]